ncbi:MAG: polymer-forming cytoskeletal protein [Patescibacteria group bacterium]|nr:polymer-forming cytoskeletal protein [Patescibacteria group bacterium]
MFKREEDMPSNEVETIIGPSVKVEGDFTASGDVTVEGAVNGSVRTERHLRIGEQAKIAANVNAGSALVAGEIIGNITVRENLEITSTGKILGDIKTKVLTVAAGATLHGKCQVGEEPRPAKTERPETKPAREREAIFPLSAGGKR